MSALTVALLALASMLPEHEPPRPPLALANGLPSYRSACESCKEAYDYWKWLCETLPEDNEVRRKASDVYQVWANVAAAADPEQEVWIRRNALGRLVGWLGWEVVVRGQFPVPFKRGSAHGR